MTIRPIRVSPRRWYLGVLGLILCLFSGALYVTVASSLRSDVDRTLALHAESVAQSTFAFWRAERASAGSGPGNWLTSPAPTFLEQVDQERLPELFSRWADKTGQLDTDRPIRFLDNHGQLLGASASFVDLALPIKESTLAEARRGRNTYKTFRLPARHIRLITHPVLDGKRVLYYVQAATSLEPVDTSLFRLRLWLLILVPSTLIITSAIGSVLASMALGPMRRLVVQMQQFMAEQLHEQFDVPKTRDELERFSVLFNDLLVRLGRVFPRLRQFSAAAAHELRTVLTVMKGEIGVTLRKPRTAAEYRALLERHLLAINDMTVTVEELLHLAQWEAAEEIVERKPVDMSELAQATCAPFQPMAEAKHVCLTLSTNGPAWVQGERRLLERVVSNLLDNAIRHTPANGTVAVLVETKGDQTCVSVQDTGSGIAPSALPRLFDRFFQKRATQDAGSSTGIGLGLCRWIVEAHRGRLEVASTPGHGTTFTASLPFSSPT